MRIQVKDPQHVVHFPFVFLFFIVEFLGEILCYTASHGHHRRAQIVIASCPSSGNERKARFRVMYITDINSAELKEIQFLYIVNGSKIQKQVTFRPLVHGFGDNFFKLI